MEEDELWKPDVRESLEDTMSEPKRSWTIYLSMKRSWSCPALHIQGLAWPYTRVRDTRGSGSCKEPWYPYSWRLRLERDLAGGYARTLTILNGSHLGWCFLTTLISNTSSKSMRHIRR